MVRAIIVFVIAVALATLVLGQFGIVGPFELLLVVIVAAVIAFLVNRSKAKVVSRPGFRNGAPSRRSRPRAR